MGFIAAAAKIATPILSLPVIRRTRRNHGLEHATIHVLAENRQQLRVAGRSHNRGFLLYGNVSTMEVEQAIDEALARMRAGEHRLAVHPNCGTNLVTTGLMTTLAAMLGTMGVGHNWMERLSRVPTVMLMIIGALIFSPSLGMALQLHFTTLGDPGEMEVAAITRHEIAIPFSDNKMTLHKVETTRG